MELNEQLSVLKKENQMYKDFCENINAEKIALDQLLVENLKSSLSAKKDAVINGEKVKKLETELSVLKNEKSVLQHQLDELKSKNVDKELSVVLDHAS